MSLREQLFGTTESDIDSDSTGEQSEKEQLAPDTEGSDLDPTGERRTGGFVSSYINSVLGRDETSRNYSIGSGVDVSVAPEKLNERYNEYVKTKPLVRAPLSIFSDAVVEPGWTVKSEIDGRKDEDMTEALKMWGKNCAIHAQQPGQDILKLVEQIPEKRRGKGTLFIEKVGTRDDSNSLGGLMMLDPSSIKIYSRENQPILVQPDDDVDRDHPITDDGRAAAYTQYEDNSRYPDSDTIAFASDELIKITYEPDEGDAWGTPLWVQIREHIDALYQKLRDRNSSIRINGHPWRIISNENWTYEEASRFLKKHFEGEISTWNNAESEKKESFAGRMDAIPHEIDVQEHTGDVPEIDNAIMDDIQAIFSVMPVSRFKISYEEGINQFVVEPQEKKDRRNVVRERRRIREIIEPVFEEKADELAGGEYDGKVTWKLEQPDDENPLDRESFDADDFATLVEAMEPYGAPADFAFWAAGVDPSEFDGGPINDPEGNPSEQWDIAGLGNGDESESENQAEGTDGGE